MHTYLEDAIEFRREHHIPFRLERARHERLLTRRLALRDVDERLVRQDDRHVRLETVRFRLSPFHRARLFQVDRPRRLLPGRILDEELKDAVVLSFRSFVITNVLWGKRTSAHRARVREQNGVSIKKRGTAMGWSAAPHLL